MKRGLIFFNQCDKKSIGTATAASMDFFALFLSRKLSNF